MMKFTVLFRRVLLALAGLFFSLGANSGAAILLWPIDPWLAAERNASELWIENRGDAPTTMQVRIVRWRQQGGFERYQNQQDVVASPPIVRIEKGNKQLIRLIKQIKAPDGAEQAYRIIVDEIPSSDNADTPPMGLKIQMRYSLPLFVYGQGIATWPGEEHHARASVPQLQWRVIRENGAPFLEVRNQGAVHVRLSKTSVRQGSETRSLADGLLGYVLPGSYRRWPLPPGMTQPTELTASINAQGGQWQSGPTR
ncbi:molecular chaperone [Salmonella enterica]|nr:molecular chaperone [Salmonella enterica]